MDRLILFFLFIYFFIFMSYRGIDKVIFLLHFKENNNNNKMIA